MEASDCMINRRSVRDFQTKEVSWEYISRIMDAGRVAPSAGNLQNWKFIVVQDEGKRQFVAEACVNQQWMARAPVQMVIVGEPEKARRFYGDRGADLYTPQNCAAAAQNMILEATNLGLGSCWVGAFEEVALRKIFGMPEEAVPYVVLAIGYPRSKPEEPAKFPLENLCYFGGWRSKIKNPSAFLHYYGPDIRKGIEKGKEAAGKAGKTTFEKAKDIMGNIRKKIKERKENP